MICKYMYILNLFLYINNDNVEILEPYIWVIWDIFIMTKYLIICIFSVYFFYFFIMTNVVQLDEVRLSPNFTS